MYGARPFDWAGRNIGYVFATIASVGRQLFPSIKMKGGMTRANVNQMALVLDSGATIDFFSNLKLMKWLRTLHAEDEMTIHCGSETIEHRTMGVLLDELQDLPLPRGEVCVSEDGIANLLSMTKLVKEGYRVQMDTNVEMLLTYITMTGRISNSCVKMTDCTYLISTTKPKVSHYFLPLL